MSEENIENWRIDNHFYVLGEIWQIYFTCSYAESRKLPDDPDDLPKENSKHSDEGTTWFIIAIQNKMWKERNNLREELL